MRRFCRFFFFVSIGILITSQGALAGRQENKALFKAIQDDNPAAVQQALNEGADPNALSFRGRAISVAEKGGNQEIIDMLHAAAGDDNETASDSVPASDVSQNNQPAPDTTVETKKAPVSKSTKMTSSSTPKKAPAKAADPEPVGAVQSPATDTVVSQAKTIVDSGELSKMYNPIVVDYLVNEGKERLPADVKKAALDQLVAALTSKTQVSKEEQLTMALGTLTGIAMGASGNDVVSNAGGDVESSYASEWADWIDSAFNLIHAGYSEEAAQFFEYGMVYIPYPNLQARCVKGLALARPDQAYDFLMNKLKESNDPSVKSVALPLLGLLSTDEKLPADKKAAILEVLTENTGMMAGSEGQLGAMHGLRNMNDPAAADIMKKFTTGMTTDKWVKRAAIRGLLLTYGDSEMVPLLDKMANAGSFSMTDDSDKVWAGLLLIEAQTQQGYDWAAEKLKPKRKNFFAPKDSGPDPRADIVRYLVEYGGSQGKEILADSITKYKDKDWMKTWIATGLLEFGDTSYISLVKSSLTKPEWDYTAVRIVEALAKNGDYSGLPVLEQLIQKTPPRKSGAMKFMNALSGKQDDTKAKEERLAYLRIQIADALARINVDDCVPLLIMLLNDKDMYVRSTAALALTKMDQPSALDGMVKAMSVNYGTANKIDRTPNVQAHVIRLAAIRFPSDPRTAEICESGTKTPYAAVQFIGVVEQ